MKALITLSLLGFSSFSFAEYKCNQKVSANKVVVFVDSNNSAKEIEGAAKAACQRGESFMKIPKATASEISKMDWLKQEGLVTKETLTKELSLLAKNNIAVSSMVVSGHDGGGKIHGELGEVNKYEIIDALKAAYKDKPKLLQEMKSVFMWGCWSMGPSEIEVWKKGLPSLKLTAGFMDMGPLNTTEASHSVLNGLLVREKSLIEESDSAKLKKAIEGIPNINVTLPSIYTDAVCGDMLYYKTQGGSNDPNLGNDHFKPGTHFLDFDANFSCSGMAKAIETNRKELIKYFYGELPLPKDESGSPIRRIYAFLRNTAKCHAENHMMNGDRVFLLRFYEEVKENFAKVFHTEIGEANKEYVGITGLLADSPLDENKKSFQRYLLDNKDKYFNPRYPNMKNKSRKDILNMISYLDGLLKQPFARDPKNAPHFYQLKSLGNAMNNYLFSMDPKCMNFMDWHEVEENPAYAWCPYYK